MYFYRYVSISTSSFETTFYLCEVQVLSPASEQIIRSQCSFQEASQQSLKSFSIYQNNCFHLQSESKLNFSQSVDFCKKRGFDLIHNKTDDGGKSYLFARLEIQELSVQYCYLHYHIFKGILPESFKGDKTKGLCMDRSPDVQ